MPPRGSCAFDRSDLEVSVICPNCGSNVPDGLKKCPACHADMVRVVVERDADETWCKSCGSLVPRGELVCPCCGMPVDSGDDQDFAERAIEAGDATGDLSSDSEQTNVMPRIESAIPSEDDETSTVAEHDRLPRAKVMIITMATAVAAVSGLVLLITHPWNPGAFDDRAKTDASTSMAGYPGAIKELKGQDKGSSQKSAKSGDDATYEALSKAYKRLKTLEKKVDENENLFNDVAYSGSQEQRNSGKSKAEAISLEISNLIGDIKDVDVTSGTYADDEKNLLTLGNYMRNRMDALYEAWKRSAMSDNPQTDKSLIEEPLKDGGASVTASYKKLFDDNYDDWKPTKKSSQ